MATCPLVPRMCYVTGKLSWQLSLASNSENKKLYKYKINKRFLFVSLNITYTIAYSETSFFFDRD